MILILALLLGVLFGLYAMLVVGLALLQRRFVFCPSPAKADLSLLQHRYALRPVTIRSDSGLALISWFAPPRRANKRTIIYFQGNAGNLGDRVERVTSYLEAGYGLLLVGYRGYGGLAGRPSEAGLYADARANLDFLRHQGIDAKATILFGESLGSAVAVQMATEHPALALVLEAPLASIVHSARARYPFLVFEALVRDKFDSLAKIKNIHLPLLIVHGIEDRTTPVRFGKMLFAAANEPKTGFFPEGAGHGDLMAHGLAEYVLMFLARI